MTTMGAILGSQWSTVLSDWPLAPQLDQMLADHVALQSTLTAQFVTTFSAGRVIIVLHHCIFCSNLPPDTWPLTGRPFRASAIDSLSSMSQECQGFIFKLCQSEFKRWVVVVYGSSELWRSIQIWFLRNVQGKSQKTIPPIGSRHPGSNPCVKHKCTEKCEFIVHGTTTPPKTRIIPWESQNSPR